MHIRLFTMATIATLLLCACYGTDNISSHSITEVERHFKSAAQGQIIVSPNSGKIEIDTKSKPWKPIGTMYHFICGGYWFNNESISAGIEMCGKLAPGENIRIQRALLA